MKKQIRTNILEQKDRFSSEIIEEKSIHIFNTLCKTDFYKRSNNIMLYISFGKEVITKPIIEDLQSLGKKIFIPVTVPETKSLIVSELIDLDNDLEVGHFGVMEPKEDCLRPVDPSVIDLLIVPGVAFDKTGYRIGYGGGYYDRFIPRLSKGTTTVALAFEMQLIDKIPTSHYDIPVEYIITEKQLIHCKKHNK